VSDERTDNSGIDLADDATVDRPEQDDPSLPSDDGASDELSTADRTDGPGSRHRLRVLLPWILVVLAIAVAVASTWRWQELAALERTREDVAAASSQFVSILTTWDASAGMGGTRDDLREAGTEDFGRDIEELFGTTEDLQGLATLGARSDGEVRQVYVQSLSGDRAESLVVVVQQVSTDEVEVPEIHLRYASLGLLRVDGRWLVDDLELLLDTSPGADTGAVGPEAGEQQEDEG
jgi:Mce-associated membrane protein